VQKIITVMIMVIMRIKPSPKGFMAMARVGLMYPKMTAMTIATLTCTQREA
jgi:hypothetical protein